MKIVETAGDSITEKEAIKRQLFALLVNERTPARYKKSYTIMAKPMACPRPRFTRFGRPYNPIEYTKWKNRIAEMVSLWDSYIFPIELDLEFHFVTQAAIWGPHGRTITCGLKITIPKATPVTSANILKGRYWKERCSLKTAIRSFHLKRLNNRLSRNPGKRFFH